MRIHFTALEMEIIESAVEPKSMALSMRAAKVAGNSIKRKSKRINRRLHDMSDADKTKADEPNSEPDKNAKKSLHSVIVISVALSSRMPLLRRWTVTATVSRLQQCQVTFAARHAKSLCISESSIMCEKIRPGAAYYMRFPVLFFYSIRRHLSASELEYCAITTQHEAYSGLVRGRDRSAEDNRR